MGNFYDIKKRAWMDGIILDGCGTDERYYTFGAYMDLCGAKPEDLMPDGGGSSGRKASNLVSANTSESNLGWELAITTQEPITSTLQVGVEYTYILNGDIVSNSEIFVIENGSKGGNFVLSVPNGATNVTVSEVTLNPKSDENYNYITEGKGNYLVYYGVFPTGETDNLTSKDVKAMTAIMIKEGDNEMAFKIPEIGIEGINDIEDESLAQTLVNSKAYDLVVAYDSKLKEHEIVDLLGETDKKFVPFKEIDIDGKSYTLLIRRDPSTQRNVYDTLTGPVKTAPIEYSIRVNHR